LIDELLFACDGDISTELFFYSITKWGRSSNIQSPVDIGSNERAIVPLQGIIEDQKSNASSRRNGLESGDEKVVVKIHL